MINKSCTLHPPAGHGPNQPPALPHCVDEGHTEQHAHAKVLVQHLHTQHTPLIMVVGALAKGLAAAAAKSGSPGEER